MIEHEEARIDPVSDTAQTDIHRMCVSAEVIGRFIQGDLVARLSKTISAGKAGNTRADHCDLLGLLCHFLCFVLDKLD